MEQLVSNWISSELIDSITHTIIQSFWQGAILALIVFGLFQWRGKENPIVTHRIAVLGIVSLFVCTLITFLSSYMTGFTTDISTISGVVSEWTAHTIVLDESALTFTNKWIGFLWLFGVAIYSIKFFMDIGIVQYIRYSAEENDDSKKYKSALETLQKEHNTNVLLKVSSLIQAPVTIGFLKPIILFPVGMLTKLTLVEVESILRHELAHIARKDYLVNIIQSMMEIVLFYHPLVWWLSKVAREEREYCCDDLALVKSEKALDYAKTLVRVQELVLLQKQSLAMSFADQSLMNRIKRIMNLPKSNKNMREKLIATAAVFALLVFMSKDMIASVTEKIWSKVEIENADVPRESVELDLEVMAIDTLPSISTQSYSMTKSDDEGSITLKKENGKITKLEIDGKDIPESEYDQYEEEIQNMEDGTSTRTNTWMFSNGAPISGEEMQRKLDELDIDVEIMGEGFDADMQKWAESFGSVMGNWGEQFGNSFDFNFEEGDSVRALSFVMPDLDIDEDVMIRLEDILGGIDMEGLRIFEFDDINDNLSEMLGGQNFDELRLRGLENDDDFSRLGLGRGRTVEDKIGYELRRDRLIATGEVSEVELTGKHMKINGDKQPTNIWNKYKEIFEETSGIVLSKDSKLKFNVEGKKTIKKSSAF